MDNLKKVKEDEVFIETKEHNLYCISNYGRVYSKITSKILKVSDNGKGYKNISFKGKNIIFTD